jgi:hypothetical protein
MKRIYGAMALLVALSFGNVVRAQSPAGIAYGQVPTSGQWNLYFSRKADYLGAPSCITTGCIMTGEIITNPSSTSSAGLNIGAGIAPTFPNNGDVWTTSAGMYVRINGSTVGPLLSTLSISSLTFGAHLTAGGTSYNGSSAVTITPDATSANTVSTIVARDSSGNFAAGTISPVAVVASGGLVSTGVYAGSFSDGLVQDYTTGTARFSAGAADGFAWYNGGVGNTSLMTLSSAGLLGLKAIQITGSVPSLTLTGGTCAGTVIAGGPTAGTVTLTGACASTNTMALTAMPTVAHGYACSAWDMTNKLALLSQTSTSVSSATFTFQGVAPGGNFVATGATDVIQYSCVGY